jgi:hypothetical protein
VELEKGAREALAGGLGVGVTGPSLAYGLDSTDSRDRDGDWSLAGLSCTRRKEVRLLVLLP